MYVVWRISAHPDPQSATENEFRSRLTKIPMAWGLSRCFKKAGLARDRGMGNINIPTLQSTESGKMVGHDIYFIGGGTD